jgi:hypothetical protein
LPAKRPEQLKSIQVRNKSFAGMPRSNEFAYLSIWIAFFCTGQR